ncbi:MAG: hypothetical protein JWM57_1990 [Phycisphaerales bacterium]|nr:hypothetical protein [Phycisphaerales bacterium]
MNADKRESGGNVLSFCFFKSAFIRVHLRLTHIYTRRSFAIASAARNTTNITSTIAEPAGTAR